MVNHNQHLVNLAKDAIAVIGEQNRNEPSDDELAEIGRKLELLCREWAHENGYEYRPEDCWVGS